MAIARASRSLLRQGGAGGLRMHAAVLAVATGTGAAAAHPPRRPLPAPPQQIITIKNALTGFSSSGLMTVVGAPPPPAREGCRAPSSAAPSDGAAAPACSRPRLPHLLQPSDPSCRRFPCALAVLFMVAQGITSTGGAEWIVSMLLGSPSDTMLAQVRRLRAAAARS